MSGGPIIIGCIAALVIGCTALWRGFETFAAGQLAEDALGHRADGDWPRVPEDLKAFHSRENAR